MATLLEENGSGYNKYKTIFVEPKKLSALSNSIALRILERLSEKPMCAMDLSREMEMHEQKVYYHLNKLQRSGLVKLIGTEKRYGMVAQMYGVVAPTVAAKLHSNGSTKIENTGSVKDPKLEEFLHPFVENGKLNCKIIVGNTMPHGKYNEGAREGPYVTDLAMLLGNTVDDIQTPCYQFDTQIKENELYNNLILIGNIRTNSIIEKLNNQLPIYFDPEKEFSIVKRKSNKVYSQDSIGMILKMDNPLDPSKKILILGGKRSRGSRAAILSVTKYFDQLKEANENNEDIMSIILGYDRDSDYEIDDVEFLE